MQCFTELWCQRAGYSPDTTPLLRQQGGQAGMAPLTLFLSLGMSGASSARAPAVPPLLGCGRRWWWHGLQPGSFCVTSQSLHRFHFLTWHSVSFNSFQAVIYPSLSGASLLFLVYLGKLFLKANSLSPHVPAAEGASSMKFLASHSPCKHGLSRELFYAEVLPQFR